MHRSKHDDYSITSSANNCIDRDTWTPSARPHMVTNANLVGCSMGMSAVLAPWRSLTSCRAAMSLQMCTLDRESKFKAVPQTMMAQC